MRILLIDDEPDVLESVAQSLRFGGNTVVTAANGKEARSFLATQDTFDVIVTDVLMPESDGLEVIREVRQSSPGTWIVAISGGNAKVLSEQTLTWSRAFGADRILYKPFHRAELLDAIKRV